MSRFLVAVTLVIGLGSTTAMAAGSGGRLPSKGLSLYVEFEGVDNQADAWKATAAHAILHQTPAGTMMTDLTRQVIDHLLTLAPGAKLTGADVVGLHDPLWHQGFSIGIYDEGDGASSAVLVLNGFGGGEPRARFERLLGLAIDSRNGGKVREPLRLRGRDLHPVKADPKLKPLANGGPSWWLEGDDIITVMGPTVAEPFFSTEPVEKKKAAPTHEDRISAVLDTIEGKQPSALTHPGRAAALAEGRAIAGFAANGLFFLEPAKPGGLSLGGLASLASSRFKPIALPSARYLSPDSLKRLEAPADPLWMLEPLPMFEAGPAARFRKPDLPWYLALDPQRMFELPKPPDPPQPVPSIPSPEAPPAPVIAPTIPHYVATAPAPLPAPALLVAAPEIIEPKPEIDPIKALGLDHVGRVVGRWGFQGKALLTVVRVEAPSPRTGLLGLLDQPGFRKDRLPPIPRDAGAVIVGSFDLDKSLDNVLPALKTLGLDKALMTVDRAFRDATGQRLREDFLKHLGPTWCASIKNVKREKQTGLAWPVVLVSVDDTEAFGKVLDAMAARLNTCFDEALRDPQFPDDLPVLRLERLPAPEHGYRLISPARLVPFLSAGREPTVLLGKSFLILGRDQAQAREALAAESGTADRWSPSLEVVKGLDCLPESLTSLNIGNPGDSIWPELIAGLPSIVQTLARATEVDAEKGPPASKFLAVLGVPRRGGFRARIAPANVPEAEAIRALLFSSVLATLVDAGGVRVIAREAVPFSCLHVHYSLKSTTAWKTGKGLDVSRKLSLDYGFGD